MRRAVPTRPPPARAALSRPRSLLRAGSIPVLLFSPSTFAFHRAFPSSYTCTGNVSDNPRACAETPTRAIRAAHPEWAMGHGDRGASHYGIGRNLTDDDVDRLMPFYDAGLRFSEVGIFVLDERSPNDASWADVRRVRRRLLAALKEGRASAPARLRSVLRWQKAWTHKYSYAYVQQHLGKYDSLWV